MNRSDKSLSLANTAMNDFSLFGESQMICLTHPTSPLPNFPAIAN